MKVPVPVNESRRIAALKRYRILDTGQEQASDDFVNLASMICGTPIALISLIDTSRKWFKSRVGLEIHETPRDQAFCAHTILDKQTMVIPDAQTDPRFAENPLVKEAPQIRFYAGSPLIDRDGLALGSLCVIDRKPRELPAEQKNALEALSRQVIAQLELRRTAAELANALASLKTIHGLLPICSYCKGIRNDNGYWQEIELYMETHTEADFSHGICPTCLEKHHPEVHARLSRPPGNDG